MTGDDPRRVLTGAPFEIEFRCRFESEEEAFAVLPFLRPSLRREVGWTDTYYGLDIFRRGEVLRFASVTIAWCRRSPARCSGRVSAESRTEQHSLKIRAAILIFSQSRVRGAG